MKEQVTESNELTCRISKNTANLALWTGTWLAATALAAFGPKYLWDFNTLPTILGILAHLVIGFGMIAANKRHLNGLDELQQKIQLDAMALALGVGLVVGVSYELLEDIRLISFEPEISHLIMLMALTYIVGIILGNRKYR